MPGRHTEKQKRQARHVADSERRRGKSPDEAERIGWATANARKAERFELLSLSDYYDLFKDMDPKKVQAYHADAARRAAPDPARTAHVDRPPPAVGDVASRAQNERRVSKFPRRPKPTVRMKPISAEEAMTHLRSGTYNPAHQKSLRWLAALKALTVGYGRTSGGGALKAANRGSALPLLGPSGRVAGKPGGHYRHRRISGKPNFGPDGRPGPVDRKAKSGGKLLRAHQRPDTSSDESPRVLDGGSATELSNSVRSVVIKSGGDAMPTMDFNDLFKSELGGAEVALDCPHCEVPITKSDLEKAHKGKGAATHLSGPKRGKPGAHVRDQNPEGGTTRGGDGHGVHTPSRGVPGAKKHDEVRVQSAGGHKGKLPGVSKAGGHAGSGASCSDDSSSGDAGSEDTMSKSDRDRRSAGGAASTGQPAKKSVITIRGTDHVQWVDDGGDARLAKSILEGSLGGTPPTQPLDLNNDSTRLLV
jgi:hypothetical protein